jgi:hypothetical protein
LGTLFAKDCDTSVPFHVFHRCMISSIG